MFNQEFKSTFGPSLQIASFLALMVTLVSCGGNTGPDPATSRNNPGTGTSTLLVTVDITANDDAGVIGGFNTDYRVAVEDGSGNPVSGATVTIQNSSLGVNTLPETQAGSGDYRLSGAGFPGGDFSLEVVRGADNIRGVVVGGPGVHSISSPSVNDTVPAGTPLTVRWSVPLRAQSVELDTRDFNISLADLGTYQIAGVDNPARDNQRLRVYRYNEVSLYGGLSGSRMRVTVRQTVEPYVVQ